ncbi:MAG: Na/Pi symporter [Gorillibacterium sp.]|nr:Na/Pi symporter [Gorillibacterium sp.]
MLHSLILPLVVGFSLFMFGMKLMEYALEKAAGPNLPKLLSRFTSTPVRGMATSTALTAVLQSSTAVTVIAIGLVNAGLMKFSQTLGIILGTNIGTCLTTELLGLNINRLGIPLLCLSTVVTIIGISLSERFQHASTIVYTSLATAGFACVLLGMSIMQGLAPELETYGMISWMVQKSQESLLWGMLAGAAVTAVIHSSAAAIAMTMSLVSAGVFPPELGIAVILGSNVGTCVTALAASIGSSRFGAYVAWTHTLLNVLGAALFYPLIPFMAEWVASMSGEAAVQMARAQTIFNVTCSLVALPFCYLPALSGKKSKPI